LAGQTELSSAALERLPETPAKEDLVARNEMTRYKSPVEIDF
jgi:hypothetical protein